MSTKNSPGRHAMISRAVRTEQAAREYDRLAARERSYGREVDEELTDSERTEVRRILAETEHSTEVA